MDLIAKVFSKELDKFVSDYLDNILVYSTMYEEHLLHLEMVLKKLRAEKLYGMLSKCRFVVDEVEYLEHLISRKGVSVGQQKVQVVKVWPRPKKKLNAQSFL